MKEKVEIQKKVADAILQAPVSVRLGGKDYKVARPTFGTLVRVSELITTLPHFEIGESAAIAKDIISEAKFANEIPSICAVLILGSKKAEERVFWFFGPTRKDILAKRLFHRARIKEMRDALEKILLTLDLGDFFALTTFLNGINLTKPTKVETKATAPGR